MRSVLCLVALTCLSHSVFAQYVYTIKADSVKITNCDSAELIIENHTQNVPGFLFNTGKGRTIFQRGAQQLSNGIYLIGADTLRTTSNGWVQGGNAFGTTGILGTLDYNHLDFYTNNSPKMRLTNTGRLGIGITSPVEAVDIAGNMNLNDGTDNLATYKIDDLPVLSFGTFPVYGGFYNIMVGDSAGYDFSGGAGQVYIGYMAGKNAEGQSNTSVGWESGTNSSGSANVFVGGQSGISNDGGVNTFVGYTAGAFFSGSYNSTLGYQAGYSPTGNYNTYLGCSSGAFTPGNSNVQIGFQSGMYSGGSNNVLIGQNAGFSNGGNDNVFVGTYAGHTDSTTSIYGGSYNQITLIGDSSDASPNGIVNSTAIGHRAIVRGSNTMVFGDSATNNWYFNSGATPVTGAAFIVGSNYTNGNGAYLSTGGTWTNASDRNKKENFQRLDGNEILKKISRLPLTRWNYKGQSEQHIGPVAQDFYRIFQVGENDKTISTIDPSGIALIGVQELYKRWKIAEKKSAAQHIEIEKQQAVIENLQSTIQSQEERLRLNTTEQNHEIELIKEQMTALRQLIASPTENKKP